MGCGSMGDARVCENTDIAETLSTEHEGTSDGCSGGDELEVSKLLAGCVGICVGRFVVAIASLLQYFLLI